MNDLDVLVQGTLKDRTKEPIDRAVMAVAQIEKIVTAEAGLEMGTPLPVPKEWEHKVPLEAFGPEPVVPHSHRESISALVLESTEGQPALIFDEPEYDIAEQSKFNHWWRGDR